VVLEIWPSLLVGKARLARFKVAQVTRRIQKNLNLSEDFSSVKNVFGVHFHSTK